MKFLRHLSSGYSDIASQLTCSQPAKDGPFHSRQSTEKIPLAKSLTLVQPARWRRTAFRNSSTWPFSEHSRQQPTEQQKVPGMRRAQSHWRPAAHRQHEKRPDGYLGPPVGRCGKSPVSHVGSCLISGHDVATKLRCLGLCKVEMSLGGLAGSVSRLRGDHHIGAAPASTGSF
jgi:hypothetical protein